MLHFLESMGIVKNESGSSFKTVPAIIIMLLMLVFFGSTVYILISSLS